MKPLNTILASVYITAMITSSLSQVTGSVALASGLNPAAVRKTLQMMIAELNSAGISANYSNPSIPIPVAAEATSGHMGGTSPVLSAEDLQKIISAASCDEKTDPTACQVDPPFVRALHLGGDKDVIPAKHFGVETSRGQHFVSVITKPGCDNIIFLLKQPGVNYLFLTNSTRILQTAVIMDSSGSRPLVPEAAAQEAYRAQLTVWRAIADRLPTAPAANS